MIRKRIIFFFAFLLFIACRSPRQELSPLVLPEPCPLEKILAKGTLDVSLFYNTTDYYVYQGTTRGFHCDLAQDFARYLGVKLNIVSVNHDIDSAILQLQQHQCDLLAISMTQTPLRNQQIGFSTPFFQTGVVLVQNIRQHLLRDLAELDGKEVYILKSASPYKEMLHQLEDSLQIHISITEVDQYSYEDILHLVETGEISYTVIDENIARASGFSMKNIDYSLKLKENISISWAFPPEAPLLIAEANAWHQNIKQTGILNFLFRRYFNNHRSVPHSTSKYTLIRKGDLSPFDPLIQKECKVLGWDWKLIAALIYRESQFDPEAESEVGAYGLMQIIPETAEQYNVDDYFRPDSNIYVGIRYLKYLDNLFANYAIDSVQRIKFVLASYNAGAGHILDAMRLAESHGKDALVWDKNVDYYLLHKNDPLYYRHPLSKNGYCNGPQSYKYVSDVLETYNNYKNISQ